LRQVIGKRETAKNEKPAVKIMYERELGGRGGRQNTTKDEKRVTVIRSQKTPQQWGKGGGRPENLDGEG